MIGSGMGTGLKLEHEALVFLELLNAKLPTPGTGEPDPNPTRPRLFGLFSDSALGLSLWNFAVPPRLLPGNVFHYLTFTVLAGFP